MESFESEWAGGWVRIGVTRVLHTEADVTSLISAADLHPIIADQLAGGTSSSSRLKIQRTFFFQSVSVSISKEACECTMHDSNTYLGRILTPSAILAQS